MNPAPSLRTAPHPAMLVVILLLLAGRAHAQGGTIETVSPSGASQGTTNLTVTFTLGTATPVPPTNAPISSVRLGTLTGTAITRVDTSNVSAVFTIPASEPAGAKDATVTFGGPSGDVPFTKPGGFLVSGSPTGPPVITTHPASRSVVAGGTVTFSVAASGAEPFQYQWQKNRADIDHATQSTLTLRDVTTPDAADYRCVVRNTLGNDTSDEATLSVVQVGILSYPVVDTGQLLCYDNTTSIAAPGPGAPFHGQDAQHVGNPPTYVAATDGLTVLDVVTGLTWQSSPDTDGDGTIDAADKMTWTQAQARPAALNAIDYAGHDDWRLPTIKELYSLILFTGTDPSGYTGTDTSALTPFIDTNFFDFGYGDLSAGERLIDAQYASSTLYVSTTGGGDQTLFGVNFADGRIKGYGLTVFGTDKTFYVQCVRGPATYGLNAFEDNGDGTVTDHASGLMWTRADSGAAMNWHDALAHAQAATDAGYDDWRLPDVKELQSLLDYSRSPSTHATAAIDPVFSCTPITNEAGQADFPCYWSSTTHAAFNGNGSAGAYVAFGRALGYMNNNWVDVHGAGAQRSDPKDGDPADYPTGFGPQGDAIRILNHVRLVRDIPPAPAASLSAWAVY